jgi:hypothetical protein
LPSSTTRIVQHIKIPFRPKGGRRKRKRNVSISQDNVAQTLHLKYEKFVQKKSHPGQISGHRHHRRRSTPRTTTKNYATEKERFFLPYQNGINEQMADLSRVWDGEEE